LLDIFLRQFESLSGPKLLVHGGGALASQLAKRLGIPVEMKEGRRITDQQMLDVVVMTYGGLVNKQIVAKLQSIDVNAMGLTGADGNVLLAKRRPLTKDIDYGWVGDPIQADTELLLSWMNDGVVPVIAPLTHDGQGSLLNTNADTIAQFLAVALSAEVEVSLTYTFELAGVLRDMGREDTLLRTMRHSEYQSLRKAGVIHSGMIPKLDNAFFALEGGVHSVNLMKYDRVDRLNQEGFDAYTRLLK
jgi:acetylglutamate kinase